MNNTKGTNLFAIAAIFLLALTARNTTAQTQRPGNISTNSTLIGWFTPENYQNGTWTNRITTTGTIGNLIQLASWSNETPPATTTGNFHPAVMFRPTALESAPHRMISENNFTVVTADAFTFILVYKPQTPTWDDANILNFYDSDNADSYNRKNISYASDGSDVLSTYWPNNQQKSLISVPSGTTQLVTVDNANNPSYAVLWYLGGTYKGYNTIAAGSANNKLVVGSSRNNLSSVGRRSFTGDIQELVILKRNNSTYPYLSDIGSRADLNRIHSYLAIKYGITMPDSNYLASDATTVVWNRITNAGYSNHIFGIARDDAYGLYQKQSQSASYPLLIAYTGNSLATLNSGNSSGQLADGVYAMFGSNGLDLTTTVTLSSPLPTPGSTPAVNYRKGLMYKVQLTGASTLKLKFKPGTGALPEYMLISTDPAFPPGSTQVIPTAGTIEGEVSNGSYIAFGGHRTESADGPGGVGGANLKLWLRADDASSIATEPLPAGSGKLADYPPADAPAGTIVPAVSEWKDDVRNQSYTYAMGGTQTGHLEPVYQPSNYMTNYHPALRYWGTSTTRSAWLGNTSTTVFSEQRPVKHSAFFLVNNDFGRNAWIYTMMFGSALRGDYRGPGYGVQKSGNNIVGRFRTSSTQGTGTVDLFKTGATSILGYHHNWPNGITSSSSVKFRFNGLEDSISGISNGDIGLNQASMIGPGYEDDRVIQGVISEVILYNGELSPVNLQKIESYLALKYGITLTPRPKGGTAQKFDYIFSDGMMLWNGLAGPDTKWDTWYNRVAAVIRDDDAHLHNRQSHSTNVGSILHMGVAGTRLGDRASLGDLINDTEAVMWGDNDLTGEELDTNVDRCGDYEYIFKRTWLVHKLTEGNRPIRMIVGAQNNGGNQLGLGVDAGTKAMFDKFTAGYSVCMIVADAPEKLDPGNALYGDFKAVVPMQYLDGEQQCIYTFADSITYVTFGYKQINTACAATVEFDGTKTFTWTDWTRQNYRETVNAGISKGSRDLGDGIAVTGTKIQYANGVGAPAYYPSVTGSPVAGSLSLRRRRGGFGDSKITVTINLNTPVRPEFSIYDIDGYAGQYEQVTVTGYCGDGSGGAVLPTLSYGGNPATSYYRISDNIATATARRSVSSTNKNGQLNVSFQGGVTQIVIEFAITGHLPSSSPHDLIITPIRFRQVPPPPPINEDGLSFVKDVDQLEITTCEPVDYSFYIGNVNCEPKYVNFRDTLPTGLTWADGIGFSAIDSATHAKVKITDYQGTRYLVIDSLYIPGAGQRMVTATALITDGAVPVGDSRQFDNHAWIKYKQIVENDPLDRELKSVDRETLAEETSFTAIGAQRQDTVHSTITTNVNKYSADSTVTVTLTVTNPAGNDPVPSSYLDVAFDAGFEYVDGSFASNVSAEVKVALSGNGSLSIARIFNNNVDTTGFEIPVGESTYTFRLKAPALAGLVKEATGEVSPLQIEYIFTSETDDPCVILGMADVSGTREIPYKALIANDDRASTLTGIEAVIPVLDNDSIPSTCTPDLEITTDPSHGDADFVNDSIRYTSESDYAGYDTLVYRLVCDDDTSYAYVYIYIAEIPDNISDAECYVEPPATAWDINQNFISNESNISTYIAPIAGDLDGDGIPEILVAKFLKDEGVNRLYNGIYIYWGTDREHPTLVNIQEGHFENYGFSIARVKIGGVYKPIIVTEKYDDGYLYAYDPDSLKTTEATSRIWRSSHPLDGHGYNYAYSIGFVDFDGDGEVEIYAGNQIFDAATGIMLVNGGNGTSKGLSRLYGYYHYFPFAADVTGDGKPEYLAGTKAYAVHIKSRTDYTQNSMTLIAGIPDVSFPAGTMSDGATTVADINMDGRLDVIVSTVLNTTNYGLAAWDVQTQTLIAKGSGTTSNSGNGIPFIGNVDDEPNLEILMVSYNELNGFRWDGNQSLTKVYSSAVVDNSGATGITLFDFNQDNVMELIYRDESKLRIMKAEGGAFSDRETFGATSGTSVEHPIVVDVDNDGHAEIVTVGGTAANAVYGTLRIFKSGNGATWAPARKVWNQYAYNSVNVNDDLTIPRYQMSPAAVFPGEDGVSGTSDDIRPYNNFLQQQTTLMSLKGTAIWLTPDAVADPTTSGFSVVTGNIVTVKVGIFNDGDAALGSPVHVTLYRDFVAADRVIKNDSANIQINKGETGFVTINLDMDTLSSVVKVVAMVNDKGTTYIYQPECDSLNNTTSISLIRPMLSNDMMKDARLLLTSPVDTVDSRGTYPNPVSMLYGDTLEYTIKAINANIDSGTVIIRDTLPAYLRYVPNTATWSPSSYSSFSPGTILGSPERDTLVWRFDSLESQEPVTATFKALSVSGVSASQPMFVNRAWITASDTLLIPTGNSTYHQGAGVSIVTFSASAGGDIFNATPQALDFRTSPRSGILVVPDEGYRFAGWNHDAYTPLRGERMEARTGIMLYDTLVIYGNVELRADFVPEEYPVHYHLHSGENAEGNPAVYTIESAAITLEAPHKSGDIFTGWTGSNGDEPEASVVITSGSTGERDYFANYLYSGRESIKALTAAPEDKIWSSGDELYIRTAKAGSIVRVYSPDGLLHRLQTIVAAGETRMKLQRGIYIVTLNNSVGQKVVIEK